MPTVVVTGANRGIGLELAREFANRGDRVITTCRKSSPELRALGVEVHEGVDVGDTGAVDRFSQALGEVKIDILVNNAGVLEMETLDAFDEAGVRRQFEINALGPIRVIRALSTRLVSGSKIVLITSRMGSIADNGSGGAYGYRMSKAALNIGGVSLARDLASRGIAVGIFHPGMVATDMTARFGHGASMQQPDATARMLIARTDELDMASSGQFVHANGEALPW